MMNDHISPLADRDDIDKKDVSHSSQSRRNPIENLIIIIVLTVLTLIYVFLLLSPSQRHLTSKPKKFIIQRQTYAQWLEIVKEFKSAQSNSWSSWDYSYGRSYNRSYFGNYSSSANDNNEFGSRGKRDDFFIDGYYSEKKKYDDDDDGFGRYGNSFKKSLPGGAIVPSTNFLCFPSMNENGDQVPDTWVTVRSDLNYKFLWMHAAENLWMGATATMDTPLQRKAIQMIPLNANCSEGWVRLREGDTDQFIYMSIPVVNTTVADEWVIKLGVSNEEETINDTRYHFLFEKDGYILNRGYPAFLNVMSESEYTVRGHSSGWDKSMPAGREYGALFHFSLVNASEVEASHNEEKKEELETIEQDKEYVKLIQSYPTSTEKRVISFGLYGGKPKYTVGAIRNAELASTYFPGWICRYYVTDDVPADVIQKLKDLGSEIESIPTGMGYSSGMFWRFFVASDPTVDRYIIRDVDSRLNARDRIAVEEWIESKYPVHILRDHVNHCIVMNGGMWGGVKDAVSFMKDRVMNWSKRDEYMADLYFLEEMIWPEIKGKQISHDSYCCDRYPNTRPFPTKRSPTYQHVGQVFDAMDNPRYLDIDGYIRGVPIPGKCRKQSDWIYG